MQYFNSNKGSSQTLSQYWLETLYYSRCDCRLVSYVVYVDHSLCVVLS